jgi:aminopeptidase N
MLHNFELLANAVVEQAAHDYRMALINEHAWDHKPFSEEYRRWSGEVRELERFFTGDGITAYTKLNGTMLMKKLKEEVIEHNYDMKAINKSHQLKRASP